MSALPSPRAARHARERRARLPWIRIALMIFSLVAVAALTVDLVGLRIRAERVMTGDSSLVAEALIDATTATNRWLAPDESFSVRVPATWSVIPGDDGDPVSVTVRGPHRMELRVIARPAPEGGMEALRAELAGIEEMLHLRTQLTGAVYRGTSAWSRVMRLPSGVVEAVDFIEGPRMYHVAIGAPGESFDALKPVLDEVRNGVQPGGL